MTLVFAAVESDDAILFGADSKATHSSGITSEILKLQQYKESPFVWSAANNAQMGIDDFRGWLDTQTWPFETPQAFVKNAIEGLADINGTGRRTAARSAVDSNVSHITEVLAAGWFGDVPFIAEFPPDGTGRIQTHMSAIAIGTGGTPFVFAYAALSRIPGLTVLQRAQYAGETVVAVQDSCGPPLVIWRITRDGIDRDPESKELDA